MPSVSKSQQRLFGWVNACQKGTAKNCPPNIKKVAGSISPEDARDFASTRHEGLPERKKNKKGKKMKKRRLKSYVEFRENELLENLNQINRNIASTMTGNTQQVQQLAGQVNMQFYITKLGDMLAKIESKLGNNNAAAGEHTGEWNAQAVQVLQHALRMAAAGGKKQWNAATQLKNMKKQQVPMNTAPANNGTTGPTPLNAL